MHSLISLFGLLSGLLTSFLQDTSALGLRWSSSQGRSLLLPFPELTKQGCGWGGMEVVKLSSQL